MIEIAIVLALAGFVLWLVINIFKHDPWKGLNEKVQYPDLDDIEPGEKGDYHGQM